MTQFQTSRVPRLGNPAPDESISWFLLCNEARSTQFKTLWRERTPFGEHVIFYQRDFSSPMEGGTLTTLSCYCWHLTEQETKWKTGGKVQAAPNEQPLPCCSLMEYNLFEQQPRTLLLNQSNAFTVKQDLLAMLRKTHHENQYS